MSCSAFSRNGCQSGLGTVLKDRDVRFRLRSEQKVAENLYKRGDGTLCYFFSTEDLAAKAQSAGFTTEECSYVCVQLLNRRKNFLMRRVFVHGVFRKPEA